MLKREILIDWRNLLFLVFPMITASFSDLLMSSVDTAFIGHLGATQLAAAGIAISIYTVLAEVIGALAIGYQILAARSFGNNDVGNVSVKLFHSTITLWCVSVIGIILLFFPTIIIEFITSDVQVTNETISFLQFRGPSLIFFVGSILISMTFSANRESKWGMYSALIANITNLLLDYVLIFGFGPFPEMGVSGSALSSTIASAFGFFFLLSIFIRKKILPRLSFSWNWEEFKQIFKISGPEVINSSLDYIGNIMMVSIIGLLGTYALAGSRILFIILIIIFIIALNFGVAIQINMSQFFGKQDYFSLVRIYRNGLGLSLLIFCAIGGFLLLFPYEVIRIFTSDKDVINKTQSVLMILAFSTPLMSWTTSLTGALRAFGKTKWVMFLNLGSIWLIQIPIAWVVGYYLKYGLMGVYVGYFFYFLARAISSQLLVSHILKQTSLTKREEKLANETARSV